MKKNVLRLLFTSFLLTVALVDVYSRPVDLDAAREVGARFMNANTKTPMRGVDDLQLVSTYSILRGDAAFYIFNTPNGFVIVSADDCATPILGYSDEGRPFVVDNIPIQLLGYLQGFVEQIQYGIENHVQDETISQQWELVRATGKLNNNRDGEAVEPLITALWDQGCYYNTMCPEDEGGLCNHAPTGCVATAMGMIMHYWGYPTHGKGSHTYTPYGYPTQTANFGETTYDWDNMPDQLGENSTQTQIDAVSTLLWHCGISVDMTYSNSSSGAYDEWVPEAFAWYFNYNNELERKSKSSTPTWIIDIKNSLRANIPVYYSGMDDNSQGGHAFVCDGFDLNDYLHYNWGWSGSYNGYYAIDALNVYGYQFNYDNYAIFNLVPGCDLDTNYNVTLVSNNQQMGNVYGEGTFGCSESCTITALPNEGYQFDYWIENEEVVSMDSSYTFTITTNHLLEAHFSIKALTIVATTNPISGGDILGNTNTSMLYYDDGVYFCDWGDISNSTIYWGNMYPSSELASYSGMFLDRVSVYINKGYSGKVMVYQGGDNAPELLVYQQNFRCDRSHVYCDIPLLFPVEIDVSENLWIIICYSGGQGRAVASWSHNNDNYNGRWFSVADGTWWFTQGDNDQLCWMIRGHLISSSHELNDTVDLWVGSFNDGQTCTLTAVPSDGCFFENWSEDNVIVSTNDVYSFQVSNNRELKANFTCNVVVSADPTEGGIVSGGGIYHSGDLCTVTASANVDNGYQFYCWTENGETVSMSSEYSFTITSARNLVAHFGQPIDIVATPMIPTRGTVSGNGTYNYGDLCTLTATANEGFVFVRWTENGQTVSRQENYSFVVTSNRNLIAHFEDFDSTCFVVFEPLWEYIWLEAALLVTYEDGFSDSFEVFQGIPATYSRALTQGEHISLSLTTGSWNWNRCSLSAKVCYDNNIPIFQGEFPEEESTYEFTVDCISAYANHEIIANANNPLWGSVNGSGLYDGGQTCTLSAIPNQGYHFYRWMEDGEIVSYDSICSFLVTDGRNIMAEFTDKDVCEIVIDLYWWWNGITGGNNNMVIGFGDFTSERLEVPGTPCHFGDRATYYLKVVDGSHVSVMGELGHYSIKYSNGLPIYDGSLPTEFDISYSEGYAHYEITTAILPAIGGVTTGSGTYIVGQTSTVTAIANEGYAFLNWAVNGECVSRNPSYSFMVTGDKSLEAIFVESEYVCPIVINLSWYDWYLNNTLLISYDDGFTEQLTVSIEDYDHSVFYRNILNGREVGLDWIAGQNAQMCSFSVSYVGGDLIYNGHDIGYSGHLYDFVTNCSDAYLLHEINVIFEPEIGGQITGAGIFDHGAICTLNATANEGYTFLNWTENAEIVSTEPTYTFVVTNSRNLVANFAKTVSTNLTTGWTWFAPIVSSTVDDIQDALGEHYENIVSEHERTSNEIVPGEMLKIQTNADCILNLTGVPFTSAVVTIAPGNTWFGYTGSEAAAIDTVFNSQFAPAVGDKIVSQYGGFAIYTTNGWQGTLTQLQPGHGYIYVTETSGTRTVVFGAVE